MCLLSLAREEMNVKKKQLIAIFLTAAWMVCLLSGCGNENTASVSGEGCLPGGSALDASTQVVSGSLEELTQHEIITRSSLVAIGCISEVSDPFQIKPVGGGDPSAFTDYSFQISEILRGESASDTVVVRIQGGTTDRLTTVVEEAPELEVGQEYLLFLYQPGRGGAYNTEGDYYYITGVNQGAFAISPETPLDIATADSDVEFVSAATDAPVNWSLRDAAESIQAVNEEQPADEAYVYEQAYENWQHNLDSGFITQEEFDRFVAESKVYAEVVK